MRRLATKVKNRLVGLWERKREKRHLAGLYAPDPSNLDLEHHLREGMLWLERAQDAGLDMGVAYGVEFGQDFDVSYPETTGYICQTFVEREVETGDSTFLERAIAMGDWEIAIQLSNGAVMGGKLNTNPTPAVFNTGMVLLGWAALINRTGEERFKVAATRAGDWLVSAQEASGHWIQGNSKFAKSDATLYNVKAAWGLCEAGVALNREDFVDAAVRNAAYCVSRQAANGWFPDCCLDDPDAPLLHTLAYTMQGLVGIGKLTGRDEFIDSARRLADAELSLMDSGGFLPGRQTKNFEAAVDWCCLTGSAQTSIVWSEFYALTGEDKYRDAAQLMNRYLMARHDTRNPDARLRGGVPGAWPVWGDYGRLQILNWATKFFVDALALEARISSHVR